MISFGEEKTIRIWTLISALSVMAVSVSAAEPPSAVIFIDHEKMAAGFAKGGTVLNNGAYQILTSHRLEPGQVEVHAQYGDIMYVVEGSATFVTGGQVNGEKKDNPEKPRGKSITGGQTHHLIKGDVIVIPDGVPHWLEQVSDFNNFVVKIRAGN